MECRPLHLTIKSAKDLKDVNRFSKMDVYVVVKISGDDRSKQKTPVDKDGGTSPKWNYPMKFTVNEDAAQQNYLTLKFSLLSDRSLGDREIGEVSISVKELLESNTEKSERIVCYNVKTTSGKEKGTLEFSYKFGEKFVLENNTKKFDEPVMAYPAAGHSGTSSGYAPLPPAGGYYPPPGGYHPPPPHGAPAYAGYGYPPHGGYPAPPPQGYGYGVPPAGYGYAAPVQKPKKKKGNFGMGLGAGLLGGLLIGDMVSDVGEMGGYDGGMDDAGDFDF